YLYIGLYDIFFMIDDIIIFSLAVISINAMATNEKYMKICRIIGGILMVAIGVILLFAPQILR
ncbi:MAG: glutaredoxin, partial [Candidatus Altiarchaeota archaeon]